MLIEIGNLKISLPNSFLLQKFPTIADAIIYQYVMTIV